MLFDNYDPIFKRSYRSLIKIFFNHIKVEFKEWNHILYLYIYIYIYIITKSLPTLTTITKIVLQGNRHEGNTILIFKDVKKVWDKWNLRSFILFSILVQICLLFVAGLRKKTKNRWVIMTIWSAYLLADWAASFSVGLVFDSEEKYTSGPGSGDDTGLLLVLWTPFLLLLVGGQDRITSFAIEDNELWLRHLVWLLLQISTTGFVYIQSFYQNKLWMPTLFLLIAGTIKYAERTVALYLASSDSFGISVLREADPGANYERLMSTYSHYKIGRASCRERVLMSV